MKFPKIKLPKFKKPNIKLPKFSKPSIKVPKFKKPNINKDSFKKINTDAIKNIDPEKIKEGFQKISQNVKAFRSSNPRISSAIDRAQAIGQDQVKKHGKEFFYKAGAIMASTYLLADITPIGVQMLLEDQLRPKPSRASSRASNRPRAKSDKDFQEIISRNLFNSKGLIPGEGGPAKTNPDGPAVKSNLPFQLVGTVILEDQKRSLATLQNRTQNKIYPVRMGDEIPSQIRVTKVEPYRITFVNLKNRRNEFIEMPKDQQIARPVTRSKPSKPSKSGGIKKLSDTRRVVKRDKLDEAMGNLDKILTQARVIPNFKNGQPNGFKIIQIVPGSIYADLGLKNNDVLMAVNGEPIDASKAFQMLNELSDTKGVELTVERGGSEMTFSFDIE